MTLNDGGLYRFSSRLLKRQRSRKGQGQLQVQDRVLLLLVVVLVQDGSKRKLNSREDDRILLVMVRIR
jgi:hypothetical protein